MTIGAKILACLLVLAAGVGANADPDVLSAIPAEAWGFAAVKSPQAVVDQIMLLIPFLGEIDELKESITQFKEQFGEVDFEGPAGVVLLDCRRFSGEDTPVVFLLRAGGGRVAVGDEQGKGKDAEASLPAGVAEITVQLDGKDKTLYRGRKDGFVALAGRPELVAAVINGQGGFEILPEVRQSFEQGKIVALGDFQKMRPWMVGELAQERAKILAQAQGELPEPEPKEILEREGQLLCLEVAEFFVSQLDKVVGALEVSEKGIFYTEKIVFEDNSRAAKFVNAFMGQGEPSYESLPAGTFLLAGATRIDPKQLDVLADALLAKARTYPSLGEKLGEESAQKLIADIKAFYRQFSGMAFTGNVGSPTTGMASLVVRFDVDNAGAFKKQIETACSGNLASKS